MSDLMEHQHAGVEWLRLMGRAALLDEPGLGKTAQLILGATEPALIVAPAMIHDGGVWADEIKRWRPDLDATLVSYHGVVRKDGRKSLPAPAPDLKRAWGTLILDEAHNIKNRNANWTKALTKLSTEGYAERVFMATGTALPNWAHEAYTQLCLLHPHRAKRGGELGSYWRWAERWFDIESVEHRGQEHLEIKELRKGRTWEEFREVNWGDRALRRLRADCLDLPPMTEQIIRVKLTAKQRKAYNELRKDFVTWLETGEEIAAWNHADQFSKLARMMTQLNGEGAKLDALAALLQDRTQPTLVVAHYRESVAAAHAVAGQLGKTPAIIDGATSKARRRELCQRFQAGQIDVLCATIDTIREGLTLHAADCVIFLERSYVPSRNTQTRDRIYRIGQERPVSAITLVAEGTLDYHISSLLQEKTDQQMEALPVAAWKELL
jgi:SNF2 family DNA or RNA helicase